MLNEDMVKIIELVNELKDSIVESVPDVRRALPKEVRVPLVQLFTVAQRVEREVERCGKIR